jgi:hypothetical protein
VTRDRAQAPAAILIFIGAKFVLTEIVHIGFGGSLPATLV